MENKHRLTILVMLMLATMIFVACGESNKKYNTENKDSNFCGDGNKKYNTEKKGGDFSVKWVDLGLPSGLLWADRNVGAANPEDYGCYYAWGETTPKSVYDWNTYRFAYGGVSQKTKYCNDASTGYNGFTDNLATLEACDDAATANMGGRARTPTAAEWQELLNNTTSTWTTLSGVNGCLFSSSNGSSIFLPATGFRHDSSIDEAGRGGLYWSSSLVNLASDGAWNIIIASDGQRVDYAVRILGFSVRAVCEH